MVPSSSIKLTGFNTSPVSGDPYELQKQAAANAILGTAPVCSPSNVMCNIWESLWLRKKQNKLEAVEKCGERPE